MPFVAWGQSTSIVVTAAETGEALYLAYVENKTRKTIVNTDESGRAQLDLHVKDTIKISYVGYRDSIWVVENQFDIIYIPLSAQELEAIVIFGKEAHHKRAAQGYQDIPLEFLTSVPSMTGDADIMKTITFLPGVSEGREGYAHLFVRGGDQDQNLILYDNASLFNVNHAGGIISMFNSDMVSTVDFYKSYWPSEYGGRLSSVMNIHSAQGNFKEHEQMIDLGLIYSKAKFTGPLWKDKVSYSFGGRRSMIDLVTGPLLRKAQRDKSGSMTNIIVNDFNGRIDARINDEHSLALSGIFSKDRIHYYENLRAGVAEEKRRVANTALALNYSYYPNHNTTLKAHVSWSEYEHQYLDTSLDTIDLINDFTRNEVLDLVSINRQNLGSAIESQKISITGQSDLSNRIRLNYGVNYEKRKYKVSADRSETEELLDVKTTNFALQGNIKNDGVKTTSIFSDFDYTLNPKWKIKVGIRLPYFQNQSFSKILPEPKIMTSFHLDKSTSLNAVYNMQQQSLLLMGYTNSEGGYREFYTTSDSQLPTAQSHQWSVGFFKSLNTWVDELNIELFYKQQNNLSKFLASRDEVHSIANFYDYFHTQGKNNSYGVEVLMQKTKGKLHGSLAYTYAHSTSRFPSLNGGKSFAADFDYRHNINALVIWKFRKDYKLSGQWTYKSGRPFTISSTVAGNNDVVAPNYPVITALNNYRMPAYHRLDIGLDREWVSKRRGKRQWFGLSVYNVYDKVNPFSVSPTEDGQLRVYGFLPIIPSFNIGFEL
ncbi:TonB-dependent receptor [Membranihabitans marinus]